ncbi:hypothetical protein F4804DRAFT_349616 [Jackrogersella minutella]|nr:hypothetical protein F4804DRAFT_349616 [Jackrogersella minutella]
MAELAIDLVKGLLAMSDAKDVEKDMLRGFFEIHVQGVSETTLAAQVLELILNHFDSDSSITDLHRLVLKNLVTTLKEKDTGSNDHSVAVDQSAEMVQETTSKRDSSLVDDNHETTNGTPDSHTAVQDSKSSSTKAGALTPGNHHPTRNQWIEANHLAARQRSQEYDRQHASQSHPKSPASSPQNRNNVVVTRGGHNRVVNWGGRNQNGITNGIHQDGHADEAAAPDRKNTQTPPGGEWEQDLEASKLKPYSPTPSESVSQINRKDRTGREDAEKFHPVSHANGYIW